MKTVVTPAIILKRMDYGEADRILTIITPDFGKLSILAKGSRRSKSKLAGGLELFSVTNLSYIDGKSDLKTLVSSQLDVYYRSIVEDIQRTMTAYELLKKTDKTTHEHCEPGFFEALKSGLEALHLHDKNPKLVYAWFLNRLLLLAGSTVNTDTPVGGGQFSEDTHYHFSFDDMAFFPHQNGQFRPRDIKFLRLLAKADTPEHLLSISDAEQVAEGIVVLLEKCVAISQH